jgi:N-(2-amino-2-carboxyethyl)-L-glutamate synthase
VRVDGVLQAVGHTPLVPLKRLVPENAVFLYAKLEALNPGGSSKDRPALRVLVSALESGRLRRGGTVIESSSGNMGIGLAQACAYLGMRFICVVDPKITSRNAELLRVYGAEIDVVREADPTTGDFLAARLNRVEALLGEHAGGFWPNQYASLDNAAAHRDTMAEIVDQLAGRVDYLFCAVSSCGTLRGCCEYVRDQRLNTQVWAVDAVGSAIFGGPSAKRLLPGHGSSKKPELLRVDLVQGCIRVSDVEAVVGCRRLLSREAILAGASSGAVAVAIARQYPLLRPGSTCVAILADRGERYLDTVFCDEWVARNLGDISEVM